MLSPMDLKNRKIDVKKRRYYDKEEMDEYLELIFENYKELYNENQELKKNVKTLSDGVQYYRSIETTMQKALVLAEKTAKETKDAAQLKAEAMEKDAANKAEQIVNQAEQEYEKIKDKCLHLVQQFNQYKMQLQQVATAQLEMITSDTFDVYSPEIEAIREEKQVLPDYEETPVQSDTSLEFSMTEDEIPETLATEESNELLEEQQGEQENFDKTMQIPDVKKELGKNRNMSALEQELDDVLTADTIDLSDTLKEIQKPQNAKTQSVQDALVLEPVDAVVSEPMNLEPIPMEPVEQEVLEPIEDENKEAPTLDSLLQSINLGNGKKNKKKKGQDEDPFEFLGSVDDF